MAGKVYQVSDAEFGKFVKRSGWVMMRWECMSDREAILANYLAPSGRILQVQNSDGFVTQVQQIETT